MELNKKTIIVGGLPKPIGGVTAFLLRLVKKNPDNVKKFIDLYPSDEKDVPDNIKDKFIQCKYKFLLILWMVYYSVFNKRNDVFFNFSSAKSLLIFMFIPKMNNTWSLMLHHGNLNNGFLKIINKKVLNKFDVIYSINERQDEFYKLYISDQKIKRQISYIPATVLDIDDFYKNEISKIKKMEYKVLVGSGCPKKIYQHNLLIDIVNKNKNVFLFLFLYDEGELRDEYIKFKHNRIKINFDKSENIFNYYLANADLYVRPTLEDSFGIACADAVEFGVNVIASNVCKRYKNVLTYNVESNQELYDLSKRLL